MKRVCLLTVCLMSAVPLSAEPVAAPAASPLPEAPERTVPEKRGLALDSIRPIRITGQVADVRDDVVVIQKGKERWEVARHPGTRIKGELRKGARVTVDFRAVAATIEVRDDRAR